MATLIQQQNHVSVRPEQDHQHLQQRKPTEDAALAGFLNTKLRIDQASTHFQKELGSARTIANLGKDPWTYPQSMEFQQQPYYYYAHNQQSKQQQLQQQQPHRNRPSRPRTSSSNSSNHKEMPIQVQKSSSTPSRGNQPTRSSALLMQQQQQHRLEISKQLQQPPPPPVMTRPPSLSSTASSAPSPAPSLDSGRRSSITSVSSGVSNFSIRSNMSINTKLSLSKRLRKVFSMSHLRSSSAKEGLGMLASENGSNVSLATVHETEGVAEQQQQQQQRQRAGGMPTRRRSFATLSGLFQKQQQQQDSVPHPPPTATAPAASQPQKTQKQKKRLSSGDLRQMAQQKKSERPALRVDTNTQPAQRPIIKGRSSSTASDSPLRLLGHDVLPSPTPSTSSASSNRQQLPEDDMAPPPSVGLHYGLPLHGSPRLKPAASSSTSSLTTVTNASLAPDRPRKLQFCPTIQVHETFAASEYDRRCDSNATCQRLTPLLAMKIKQELNEYKLTDMEVHVESRQYTHFFL